MSRTHFAGPGQEAGHVGSSKADKAASHERTLKAAAARIRRDGVEGLGVADLMREAGLTHGGFYRHFGSRDDLVAEAIEQSLQELRDRLIAAAKDAEPGEGWKAMVRSYLSLERCDHLDDGCPIAALAPDI